jgi:hypothetical protein
VTEEAGVRLGDRISVGATFADYDNDGDQDLFVTSTRGGNVLFRNSGGKFQDVTNEAGVAGVAHSQTAAFFDYDNDGYLDLLVTNTAGWTTDDFDQDGRYYRGFGDLLALAFAFKEPNVLYHNNRDGSFTDVTQKSGLAGEGWSGDIAVFDVDGDGSLDVFVTNMFGQSRLYRNHRDGTFDDVTDHTLGRTSWGAIGAKAFDWNNDGTLDLFVTDMHSDMWVPSDYTAELIAMVGKNDTKKFHYVTGPQIDHKPAAARQLEEKLKVAFQLAYEKVLFGNSLYKSGGGAFVEMSDAAQMETFWPWGIATGDFDCNGFEDVFLPSGMGYPFFYVKSPLMMNNGDDTFTDHSATAGIDPPARGKFLIEPIGNKPASRSSRAAATGDFDGDGRLDIMVNNFNDTPYYLRNVFPQRNYVAFRLRGSTSNSDAIGALVRIHSDTEVMTRQVHAAGGYLSHSSKTVHFGLGNRSKIDRVEIRWPAGATQVIDNPAINELHEITEPND